MTTEMPTKLRRVPIFAKVLIIVFSVLFLIGGAFTVLGAYVSGALTGEITVMPNFTIDWIDISGLTYEEAFELLDVADKEQRAVDAAVTLRLPPDSLLHITGADIGVTVNTREAIKNAIEFGRGSGFIGDTLYFIERYFSVTYHSDTIVSFNIDQLYNSLAFFVADFNHELAQSVPRVNDENIVITLGAGHTYANLDEIFSLVLRGLFESYDRGETVVIDYFPAQFEEFKLVQELELLWQATRVLPVSAMYDRETRTIIPDAPGVTFDFPEAMALLRTTGTGESAIIELFEIEPDITKEYLESFLFVDIIGEETTHADGSNNRLHNIMLAANAIDGYVIEPGEEFSFNRIVGRRTAEAGFRLAPILSGGQFIPGLGGGICQVSSTLFSAIMDTDIQITERRPHGRPIGYLPRGRDATVAWGHIDFRFVNNTEHPMRINALLEGRTVSVVVEGTWPEAWDNS